MIKSVPAKTLPRTGMKGNIRSVTIFYLLLRLMFALGVTQLNNSSPKSLKACMPLSLWLRYSEMFLAVKA